MAEELRWESLIVTTADGTTANNAAAEFRNDSSDTIHIRRIEHNMAITGAAPDEGGTSEISKAPTYQGSTNNGVFYRSLLRSGAPPTGATPVDGRSEMTRTDLFPRGQLTLEPNESLFLNHSKTSGGALTTDAIIGYHY